MKLKRILSVILTVSIITTSFSFLVQANAQTDKDLIKADQSTADIYDSVQTTDKPVKPTKELVIRNKYEFFSFMTTSKYWESNYKITLACDIDMKYKRCNPIEKFIENFAFNPIERFSGKFDGCGHAVRNFSIKNGGGIGKDYELAFVKNLNIFAEIKNVSFENYIIKDTSSFYHGYDNVSGFVLNNNGTISNVNIISGDIIGINNYVGVSGFVKNNEEYGVIDNCLVNMNCVGLDINGISAGFVYKNFGKITSSNTTIPVCKGCHAGGFVSENAGIIEDCNSYGKTTGGECVGGFCGINSGYIISCKADSSTNAQVSTLKCGGFVGENKKIIENCISKGSTCGGECVGGFCGTNSGHIISCNSKGPINVVVSTMRCGGFVGKNEGIIEVCNAISITTAAGEYIGGFCGENDFLIDLCSCVSKSEIKIITNIMYCGGFVGKNFHTINNCSVVGGGEIHNKKYVRGFLGGFAGESGGIIKNATTAVSVKNGKCTGGFCGNNIGIINGCKSEGSVTANATTVTTKCGGFVGNNEKGKINGCTATGNAAGQEYVGGFVGVNNAEISSCNAYGKATSKTKIHTACAGGFVGENEKGTIIDCTATGGVDSGSSSGQAKAGGFVGINKASISISQASGYVYLSAGTFQKDDGCGGFVGRNNKDGSIDGCYAECTIETTNKKKGGGFVGEAKNKSTIMNSKCKSKIVTKAGIKNNKKFCQYKDKKAVIENCYVN